MASRNSNSSGSSWTPVQNKQFEKALAKYEEDTPDRWEIISRMVEGKNVEDVKRQYAKLLEDVRNIDSGRVRCPNYYK